MQNPANRFKAALKEGRPRDRAVELHRRIGGPRDAVALRLRLGGDRHRTCRSGGDGRAAGAAGHGGGAEDDRGGPAGLERPGEDQAAAGFRRADDPRALRADQGRGRGGGAGDALSAARHPWRRRHDPRQPLRPGGGLRRHRVRGVCLLVQVETAEALERLEEIASVDGVDGVFFGPSDISASMGLPGQPNHPDVKAAILDALERLKTLGVPGGILTLDPAFAKECIAKGMLFTAVGMDLSLLVKAATALRADF